MAADWIRSVSIARTLHRLGRAGAGSDHRTSVAWCLQVRLAQFPHSCAAPCQWRGSSFIDCRQHLQVELLLRMNFYPLRLAGYGLLAIGIINLVAQGTFAPALLKTATGRLEFSSSLVLFAPWLLLSLALIFLQGNSRRRSHEQIPLLILHRLLLPLLVGYLLLVPLMIRDALGYNQSVQAQIGRQLTTYRASSRRLLDEVRPLTTPLAVAQVLQRYPSLSIGLDPSESAAGLKRKLSTALANGEARLETRFDDLRRSRLEGLFKRTIAASCAAFVTAAALAGLRLQNLAAIRSSGHKVGSFFRGDLLPDGPGMLRQRGFLGKTGSGHMVFSEEWLVADEGENSVASQSGR